MLCWILELGETTSGTVEACLLIVSAPRKCDLDGDLAGRQPAWNLRQPYLPFQACSRDPASAVSTHLRAALRHFIRAQLAERPVSYQDVPWEAIQEFFWEAILEFKFQVGPDDIVA